MKKIIGLIIFLLVQVGLAQEKKIEISVSFEDKSYNEVILILEERTGYHFYFPVEWLPEQKISGSFQNAELVEILEEIFAETQLNFHILENRAVVLTRNNMIYDQLPQGFFGELVIDSTGKKKEGYSSATSKITPIFYREETAEAAKVETVRIGKENSNSADKVLTLSGVVRDSETGRPIPNLVISLNDGEINAVTNINGVYEIEVPSGMHQLNTSSLSYEDVKKRLIIYSDGRLNIDLEENFESLEEIFLESGAEENIESAVTGAEEIDIENIKNIPLVLGERNVFKVALTLPGVSSAGEGAAGFNVRGGRADQNLILLDGAVIYNPTHFFGIFSALNPFAIGSAEIFKGSIPAEYGGRLSSVFDIQTEDGNMEEFAAEISIGPITGNVLLEIPLIKEKSSVMIGGRAAYSNWVLKAIDDASLENTGASFYDAILKYTHEFNLKNKLEITGYHSNDQFRLSSDSLYNYNNSLVSLRYSHRFNQKSSGELSLSNSNYEYGIDYENKFSSNFISGYSINETAVKLNFDYALNDAHELEYGTSGKLYLVEPGFIKPEGENSLVESIEIPQEKGVEGAVYLSDNFEVDDKLLINAGLRYSFYASLGESTEMIYEPGLPKNESTIVDSLHFGKNEVIETYGGPEIRLSARYFLTPDLSVKASYNTLYQYIHTLTNNTTISPTDTYQLAGLNLEPKKAYHYSLGFYRNFKENMYETSIEGYFRTSRNMIDFEVGADLFLNKNIETEIINGEGRAYGIELMVKKNKGKLNGWVSYAYSRSLLKLAGEFEEQRVNSGEFFPTNFDKPHNLSIVANYKFTHRYSLSANFMYQTGRPVTFPLGKYFYNGSEFVFYSDRNQFRIPDYYRLDLSFNVEGNHKNEKIAHSFWSFSIYNVLGRDNAYSVFFVTEDGEVEAYKSSIFSMPIPTLTYNLKF